MHPSGKRAGFGGRWPMASLCELVHRRARQLMCADGFVVSTESLSIFPLGKSTMLERDPILCKPAQAPHDHEHR